MTRAISVLLGLGILAATGVAADFPRTFQEQAAVMDSLRDVEPWQRRQWLAERGLQDYYKAHSWRPTTDSGLRCVGRWSYGPSVKVSLRVTADDTIVCLARGSGSSIIRFRSRDSLRLDLLSDINCNGIVSRAIIDDTLVYCGMNQGGTGIEVWGVSDLTSPHRLSYVYLPPIMDIAVKDTFLYATGYVQDSLRIFNVADPRNPVQVGACSDSGYPMCVSGDYCYLADRGGINIIDASDPTNPHRVGKAATSGIALSVAVRDSLCFIGVDDVTLRVFDVKDPTLPFPVGSLSGIEAHDIYLPPTCDTVLYTSKLHVINIASPANPRQIGSVDCPGWDYGVTAAPALSYALVADYFDGLVAVDIQNPTAPALNTNEFSAGTSNDIWVDGQRAYVAQYFAGLRILDITSPASPAFLGSEDTFGVQPATYAACAYDSFAFVGWTGVPYFRSFQVSDAAQPVYVGGVDVYNFPQDMVLRDTFIYVAEQGKLQIINVARPREPVLVGSCNLPGPSGKMDMQDSLAYVTNTVFSIVNVANPAIPTVVGNYGARIQGVDVAGTTLFGAAPYTGLLALDVTDPTHPYALDSLPLTDTIWWNDVVVFGSRAYVGGERVWVVDVSDPRDLRLVPGASWTPPYLVERMEYRAPYIYAACLGAGVCILESTAVGVGDRGPQSATTAAHLRVVPSPARGLVLAVGLNDKSFVSVFDATGRDVSKRVHSTREPGLVRLNIDRLPRGLYFLCEADKEVGHVVKFVKQ